MSARPSPIARADEGSRGRPIRVETPEGVGLTFFAAPVSDRVAALLLDVFLLTLAVVLVCLLLAAADMGPTFTYTLVLVTGFAARFVYFTASELKSRGATFGKRRARLRVVDARGGALTAEAVLVRNVLRELELFLPLMVLASAGAWLGDRAGLARIAGVVWALLFAAVPVVHPHRRRIGDLFAGTIVVVVPEAALLDDVGHCKEQTQGPAAADDAGIAPTFSDAQLDVYGEFELSVLEDVLRRGREGRRGHEAFAAVCDRIVKKIGWPQVVAPADGEAFLQAYYAALRARLEHLRLLGRGRADQHDRGGKRA